MINTIKHEEYTLKGRRVILDTAELSPSNYETMLMTPGGYVEIASMSATTEADALRHFAEIRAALSLPRWTAEKVKQAAKEAGTGCFIWNCYGARQFVFGPDSRAQGNARSRNAKAMTAALRSMGYDAMDYCQMD